MFTQQQCYANMSNPRQPFSQGGYMPLTAQPTGMPFAIQSPYGLLNHPTQAWPPPCSVLQNHSVQFYCMPPPNDVAFRLSPVTKESGLLPNPEAREEHWKRQQAVTAGLFTAPLTSPCIQCEEYKKKLSDANITINTQSETIVNLKHKLQKECKRSKRLKKPNAKEEKSYTGRSKELLEEEGRRIRERCAKAAEDCKAIRDKLEKAEQELHNLKMNVQKALLRSCPRTIDIDKFVLQYLPAIAESEYSYAPVIMSILKVPRDRIHWIDDDKINSTNVVYTWLQLSKEKDSSVLPPYWGTLFEALGEFGRHPHFKKWFPEWLKKIKETTAEAAIFTLPFLGDPEKYQLYREFLGGGGSYEELGPFVNTIQCTESRGNTEPVY